MVWLLAYLKPKKISESAGSGGRFSKSWAYIRGEDGVGAHPVNLTVVKCEVSNPTGLSVQFAIRYSCPHLVWPYTEELFSRPFLDENRFRLVL